MIAMDKVTLMFFEDVLLNDCSCLAQATHSPSDVDDENLKRALNVQLEAIKGDIANIQHFLEA